jgi:hypothetical protein
VSDSGAIIDVVRANRGSNPFGEEIIFLVRASRRGKTTNRIRSVFFYYCIEPSGNQLKCFIPGRFPKTISFFD